MIGFVAFAAAAAVSGSDAYSVQSLHDLGACIVDQAPWLARDVLALDYRSPEYAAKLKEIGAKPWRCPGRRGDFRSAGVLFAGSLAEAMINFEVKPRNLPARIAYDPSRQPIVARSPGEEMTLCTAFHAPEQTAALFRTQPATPQESKAEEALGPVMSQCLRKDLKVEMNRPAIRSMLALAAYRIVTTPKKTAQ
jgi:hypothetical protein